jgi:prepilin peptidase CpaA
VFGRMAMLSDAGFPEVTLLVLVPGILYAAWIDYAQRRVPNWLNAALALAGLTAQTVFFGWSGLLDGFLGLLVGFAVLILPWAMHGMGAGDVKLMAAIGAWLGPVLALWAFAVGAILGGVIATAMIVSSGRSREALANLGLIAAKVSQRATLFSEFASAKSMTEGGMVLPYGVPLTIGTRVVVFSGYFGWGPWA